MNQTLLPTKPEVFQEEWRGPRCCPDPPPRVACAAGLSTRAWQGSEHLPAVTGKPVRHRQTRPQPRPPLCGRIRARRSLASTLSAITAELPRIGSQRRISLGQASSGTRLDQMWTRLKSDLIIPTFARGPEFQPTPLPKGDATTRDSNDDEFVTLQVTLHPTLEPVELRPETAQRTGTKVSARWYSNGDSRRTYGCRGWAWPSLWKRHLACSSLRRGCPCAA